MSLTGRQYLEKSLLAKIRKLQALNVRRESLKNDIRAIDELLKPAAGPVDAAVAAAVEKVDIKVERTMTTRNLRKRNLQEQQDQDQYVEALCDCGSELSAQCQPVQRGYCLGEKKKLCNHLKFYLCLKNCCVDNAKKGLCTSCYNRRFL
jgi:hypothetical protein